MKRQSQSVVRQTGSRADSGCLKKIACAEGSVKAAHALRSGGARLAGPGDKRRGGVAGKYKIDKGANLGSGGISIRSWPIDLERCILAR